ncbi:adenylate/guanylate cyclase domain-containing protein [Rhizobium halophilum]|uniref:adenylate/guanylate cyclase domain-containing protein n=1 Tax=Rhizobium halophilum TaxID=2846852 RepID=UPI001EFC622F|nr:adenylate/guanylate cyclase domain-containing protein [Rhizobium halophilum]MCF6368493.1 adenylate/guanylate cyclase domain-containing protein [Rhizobium halophilum]
MAASPCRSRHVQVIALVAAILVCVIGAQRIPAWSLIDYRTFDYLSTIRPPPLPEKGPIIVAIDEPSLAELNLQWPWPRSLHARLVSELRAAGARVVALDIIFSEPSTAEADQALAAALGPDVVLAADESVISSPQADQLITTMPLPMFTDTGAVAGIASVALHEDGVLRAVPGGADSFAATILQAADLAVPALPEPLLLQSYGGPRTYPTVSYYQALQPDVFLPEGLFSDRLVIVGLSLQNAPSISSGGADAFATPATIHNGRLTAGAEVQATIVDNLRMNDGIVRAGPALATTVLLAAVAAAVLLVWRGTNWLTWCGAGLAIALSVAGSFVLLRAANIFIAPASPSALVAAVVLIQSSVDYASERRSRRQITKAFSQYLSPNLVEKLAKDPEQLKLGGEKRELTILFCDVRGFSAIAEKLKDDPELLTQLVNRLLTPLSNVILEHRGTIDKYIGDCIMAFWNAPLPDPDHARNAVSAAQAMLQAVANLNADLRSEAEQTDQVHLELKVGIGINTGDCVVGNMGSDSRFDYSALGDAVNLAARLEAASKDYGVPVLLGETTAEQVRESVELRELQSTTVKGRSELSRVFTLASIAT